MKPALAEGHSHRRGRIVLLMEPQGRRTGQQATRLRLVAQRRSRSRRDGVLADGGRAGSAECGSQGRGGARLPQAWQMNSVAASCGS